MQARAIPRLVHVTTEDAHASLVYARAANLEYFQQYVPDEHGLLCHFGRLVQATTLPDLCVKLGFKGPMEELSMWLCLASGRRVSSEPGRMLLQHPRAPALACALATMHCIFAKAWHIVRVLFGWQGACMCLGCLCAGAATPACMA